MNNLYETVNLILKTHKIIVPKQIKDDVIQECILCLLNAIKTNQTNFNQLVIRCAYSLIYRNKKDKSLINIDNLSLYNSDDLLENVMYQHITKLNNKYLPNLAKFSTNKLDINQLVKSKGDYTHTELARLIKITRSHLLRAIANNRLGIKSVMRLKKLQHYNKKQTTSKIIRILAIENITYHELPIARSSWYYGLSKGFTYSQAYKIIIYLKQKFNLKEGLDDIC
jgi:hypothetical protein